MSPKHSSNNELPDLLRVLTQSGKSFTGEFQDAFRRWTANLLKGLPKKENPNAFYPTEDLGEFFRHFQGSPELHQAFLAEMYTLLRETEESNLMVNGKTLHDHQYHQLGWFTLSLPNGKHSPHSFLIEGGPGVGKTLVEGHIMQAVTRMQLRDVLKGRVVFCSNKSHILTQQTLNPDDRKRRIFRPPTQGDINDHLRLMEELLGPTSGNLLPRSAWKNVLAMELKNAKDAEKLILRLLKNAGTQEAFLALPSAHETLRIMGAIAINRAGVVRTAEEGWTHLSLPEAEEESDDHAYYSGDFGHGIPRSYVDKRLVLARKGAEIEPGTAFVTQKTTEEKQEELRTRVLLCLQSTLTMDSQREPVEHLLHDAEVVFVDEVKDPASFIQSIIQRCRQQTNGNTQPPFVIGASALRFNTSSLGMPRYERNAPHLSLERAMDLNVLPAVGVDRWPGKEEERFRSDTPEAMEQFYRAHFEKLSMPDQMDLPQPHECNSIIVVHPRLVQQTVERLKEEYMKRKLKAEVHSLPENTRPPYADRIFAWMHDEVKGTPHILVSSASLVTDSLDLPNLRNLTIATKFGVSTKSLLRLLGRLEHSSLHRTEGSSFRGYFRQGSYSNEDPQASLFQLLKHGADVPRKEQFKWVPLQVLHGVKPMEADRETIAKKKRSFKARTMYPIGTYDTTYKKIESYMPEAPMKDITPNQPQEKQPKEKSPAKVKTEPLPPSSREEWASIDQEMRGQSLEAILNRILQHAKKSQEIAIEIRTTFWKGWVATIRKIVEDSPYNAAELVRERLLRASAHFQADVNPVRRSVSKPKKKEEVLPRKSPRVKDLAPEMIASAFENDEYGNEPDVEHYLHNMDD